MMDGVGFDRLIAVRWGGVFFSLKNAAGATTSMHVFIPVSNRGCPGALPSAKQESSASRDHQL